MWGLSLKIMLILAYLASDWREIAERIGALGPSPALIFYLGLFGIVAGGILFAGFIRRTLARVAVALALCAGSFFLQSYEWSTGGSLKYEAFLNLYAARGHVGEALIQNGSVIVALLPSTLALFAGVALPARRRRVPSWAAYGAPLAAVALLVLIFYQRGGDGSRALPGAFTPIAYAAIMGFEEATRERGPRRPVEIKRSTIQPARDIVLIIDESIAGNYLDINHPQGVPTPLGQAPAGTVIFNFGYAASVHNCSASSNLMLRFGGTRDNYRETIAYHPSIWSYAEKAGLRSVYVDAQEAGGTLQNLMTADERREIDDFVQLEQVPIVQRDMAVADELAARLANGRPEFIYVNKLGAHFPVHNKYPPSFAFHRPALARSGGFMGSWTSDRTGFGGTREEWVQYRNSYRNVLRWNVGAFFERLFARADFGNATIFYTSDHGQDLHEDGRPGNNTHCGNETPLQQEAIVPLLVIEGAARPSRDWARHLGANRNRMTHLRIFPTLLVLMSYDREEVRGTYGAALDDPAKDDFSFNTFFNARLGREPEWQRIDISTLPSPPGSDFEAGLGASAGE